jgi:hypothetical protein
MKLLSRLAQDVSLQLSVLAVVALLIFGLWGGESTSSPGYASGHRKTCHTCTAIPAGEASRFEHYLLSHGYVDRAREGD